MNLSDNKKRLIAREFLYLAAGLISSILVYGGALMYQSMHESNLEKQKNEYQKLQSELESLKSKEGTKSYWENRTRDLWSSLVSADLYSKSINEFRNQFETNDKQIKLFDGINELKKKSDEGSTNGKILSSIGLTSFNEFKMNYFPSLNDSLKERESVLKRRSSELYMNFNYNKTVINEKNFALKYSIIYLILFSQLDIFIKLFVGLLEHLEIKV